MLYIKYLRLVQRGPARVPGPCGGRRHGRNGDRERDSFSIILYALGAVCFGSGACSIYQFLRPPTARAAWLFAHFGSMLAAYIATVTAFSVINFNFLNPVWVRWAWPTVIGTLVISRYIACYKAKLARGAHVGQLVTLRGKAEAAKTTDVHLNSAPTGRTESLPGKQQEDARAECQAMFDNGRWRFFDRIVRAFNRNLRIGEYGLLRVHVTFLPQATRTPLRPQVRPPWEPWRDRSPTRSLQRAPRRRQRTRGPASPSDLWLGTPTRHRDMRFRRYRDESTERQRRTP